LISVAKTLMENPIVGDSSEILHKTPNAKFPIIISAKNAPVFDMWRFHKRNFQYPAFLTSSYTFLEGITKFMYLPFTEDFGLVVCSSNVSGDFKCTFQVYIDHELHIVAWGRGYIEFEEYHWGRTRILSKQFVSPGEFKSDLYKYYTIIKNYIATIFPKYKIVNWSARFKYKVVEYHKKQVDTISKDIAVPEVKCAILKQALPQWPIEDQPLLIKSDLIGGVEVLDLWESKWIGVNEEKVTNNKSLPIDGDYGMLLTFMI